MFCLVPAFVPSASCFSVHDSLWMCFPSVTGCVLALRDVCVANERLLLVHTEHAHPVLDLPLIGWGTLWHQVCYSVPVIKVCWIFSLASVVICQMLFALWCTQYRCCLNFSTFATNKLLLLPFVDCFPEKLWSVCPLKCFRFPGVKLLFNGDNNHKTNIEVVETVFRFGWILSHHEHVVYVV